MTGMKKQIPGSQLYSTCQVSIREMCCPDMRLVHFKVGDVAEVMKKEDFIITEEHDSASDTCEGEDTGCSFDFMDPGYFTLPALSTEENSWQVADEAGSASEGSEWEVYCQNCAEPQAVAICMHCGHDARIDACDFPITTPPTSTTSLSHSDVILAYDNRMNSHSKGVGSPHPERPDRLRAVMSKLLASGLADCCKVISCREATVEELETVHTRELIEHNEELSSAASQAGEGHSISVTADLYVNQNTYMCSRLAAGGAAEVAGAVARKEFSAGAAIIRPPGHHAESGNSMGFCFFNNAAVAARSAQANGAKRVMILDWDVHHGNGTHEIFDEDPSVLYVSIHRHDGGAFYPGTGGALNVGHGAGEGYSVNVPWNCGDMGDDDYVAAMEHVVLPIATEYNPDIIIISAGFDAAEGDPLGGCKVTPDGYGRLTCLLHRIAPLVLLLEGGYNLKATAVCTEACLKVLLGDLPNPKSSSAVPSPMAWLGIQEAIQVHQDYWSLLSDPVDIVARWGFNPAGGLHWLCESKSSETKLLGPNHSRLQRSWSLPSCGQPRVGRHRKYDKSESTWKFLHMSHESALQAVWKKRRKELVRKGSLGSKDGIFAADSSLQFGSFASEDSPSGSSSSFHGFTTRPRPNSIFKRTGAQERWKHRI